MIDSDQSEQFDEESYISSHIDTLPSNDDADDNADDADDDADDDGVVIMAGSSRDQNIVDGDADDLEQHQLYQLHNYFMERLHREIESRSLEEEQFNAALLESRNEFDAADVLEKNEAAVLDKPAQKYSTVKIKNKRGELCCICMEHFSCNQEVYWLSCKHIFHTNCLDEWVKYKNECPSCRTLIKLK